MTTTETPTQHETQNSPNLDQERIEHANSNDDTNEEGEEAVNTDSGRIREFLCPVISPRLECGSKFNSRYALHRHMMRDHKNEFWCHECSCYFESWRKLVQHEPYCARHPEIDRVPDRPLPTVPPLKLPFKCQLCKRRYRLFKHLYNHQVKRCKKRYISSRWVVKI